jgi:hypothetical protein
VWIELDCVKGQDARVVGIHAGSEKQP